MEYYGYIYKTTNLITQKIYIGQKKSRIFLANKYLGSGKKLWNSINKYGENNFQVEMLEWCYDENQLNNREIYWIEKLDAMNPDVGYNLMSGGYRQRGCVLSEEAKKKISDSTKGRVPWNKNLTKDTDERVAQNGLAMASTRKKNGSFNNPWNKGLIKENSLSLKIVSQKTSGIHNGMYGKHLTDEQKSRCAHYGSANGCYGKPVSAETREKISQAKKGKKVSEETREKLKISHQGLHWYTNGVDNIRLFDGNEVPEGYWLGRTLAQNTNKYDRAEIVYD